MYRIYGWLDVVFRCRIKFFCDKCEEWLAQDMEEWRRGR